MPGVLVTSVVVAVVLNVTTGLPFTVAFVVGAIVSATDPVAVVATMRDVAAPRRLATLVEAESLFNDGTGIVLFAIALAAVGAAYDPVSGVATFAVAIVSSILIGAVCGFVAVRLASIVDDHLVELTLTFVVAYGTYLIANGLGQSGVIATVVAGIVLGSDAAQAGVSERTRQAIDTVWEYVAFVLTAFAFLLIGLSIVIADLVAAAGSIVWGIVAIFVGRAIVVYGILGGLRWLAARTTGGRPTTDAADGHTARLRPRRHGRAGPNGARSRRCRPAGSTCCSGPGCAARSPSHWSCRSRSMSRSAAWSRARCSGSCCSRCSCRGRPRPG